MSWSGWPRSVEAEAPSSSDNTCASRGYPRVRFGAGQPSFGWPSIVAAMISTCRRSRFGHVGGQLRGMRGESARLAAVPASSCGCVLVRYVPAQSRRLLRWPGRRRRRRHTRPTACGRRRRGKMPRRGPSWWSIRTIVSVPAHVPSLKASGRIANLAETRPQTADKVVTLHCESG